LKWRGSGVAGETVRDFGRIEFAFVGEGTAAFDGVEIGADAKDDAAVRKEPGLGGGREATIIDEGDGTAVEFVADPVAGGALGGGVEDMDLGFAGPGGEGDDAEGFGAWGRRRLIATGFLGAAVGRWRRASEVGADEVPGDDAVEEGAFGGVEGEGGGEIGAGDFRGGIEDEGKEAEAEADFAGEIAGGEGEAFDAMEPGGVLEEEEEVDDVGEGAIALDGPADFGGAAEFAGADGGAGEFGFGEACFEDGAGEDLTGSGGGLVDGIGEGAEGGFLEGFLGGKEGAAFGLDLGELFLGGGDAFADLVGGFEDDGSDEEHSGEEGEEGSDGSGEDFFATVHAPPPSIMVQRVIDILDPPPTAVDSLRRLDLPADVNIEIKL
jgi:hypothetical protein